MILLIGLIVSVTLIIILAPGNAPPAHNTRPEITITNPSHGSTVSGVASITVSVTDDENITASIYIDGSSVATASTYEWNTTACPDGRHTIRARVTDSSGLWDSVSIEVLVDNVEPTPVLFSGTFKVMVYNIMESGINSDWKEVVKNENPDILILVETGVWDDNRNEGFNAVVSEFNSFFINETLYDGYCAQGVRYPTSGEAILSRFPITNFTQIPVVPLDDESDYDVTHDFIDAVVDINGTSVHVIGGHLKAMGGENNQWRRERESEGIINYMDNLGQVPIMYLSDQNSFSPRRHRTSCTARGARPWLWPHDHDVVPE